MIVPGNRKSNMPEYTQYLVISLINLQIMSIGVTKIAGFFFFLSHSLLTKKEVTLLSEPTYHFAERVIENKCF